MFRTQFQHVYCLIIELLLLSFLTITAYQSLSTSMFIIFCSIEFHLCFNWFLIFVLFFSNTCGMIGTKYILSKDELLTLNYGTEIEINVLEFWALYLNELHLFQYMRTQDVTELTFIFGLQQSVSYYTIFFVFFLSVFFLSAKMYSNLFF